MDIFRFTNPNESTKMEQGEVINGFDSKMWIERYLTAGEFRLVSPVKEGHRELLPIGSFISHVDTTEIMIVENHEINDDENKESSVTITGRSFETFFENRIVGSNKVFPFSGTLIDYILSAEFTWLQAVSLIEDHILLANLLNPDDAIPYVSVLSLVSEDDEGISIERLLPRDTLYKHVMDILAIDHLGIKIIRPGFWSPLDPGSPDVALVIHKGVDKSSDLIFSYDTGEIVSADYFWSNKNLKNAALVTGRWVETVVLPSEAEYDRRMMYISASDIDQDYETVPTGTDLDDVVEAMQQRGVEALANQNNIALTKAEVSKNSVQSIYRTDYDVGDVVTVSGDYNEVSKMRITEFVEIEDETGSSGYPTLTLDIEGA